MRRTTELEVLDVGLSFDPRSAQTEVASTAEALGVSVVVVGIAHQPDQRECSRELRDGVSMSVPGRGVSGATRLHPAERPVLATGVLTARRNKAQRRRPPICMNETSTQPCSFLRQLADEAASLAAATVVCDDDDIQQEVTRELARAIAAKLQERFGGFRLVRRERRWSADDLMLLLDPLTAVIYAFAQAGRSRDEIAKALRINHNLIERRLVRAEVRRALWAEIVVGGAAADLGARLGEVDALLLSLRVDFGLSLIEIGIRLGLSTQAVETRYERIWRKLDLLMKHSQQDQRDRSQSA
jgi:hypothetical protein